MRNRVNKMKYREPLLLSAILLLALVLRLIFFTGINASDSLFYAEYAHNFSNNQPNFSESHLGLRLGLLLPVSIIYSIFGVNEFSSNIFVLVTSLSSIILIYFFGRLFFNEKVGLLSAFLLSFFPLDVVYATRLMSDLPSAFFIALSVYFFLKSEKNKKANHNLMYIVSGISLGIAYSIKEISLLIGLFFLIYAIYNRKIKLGYFLMLLGFILIFSMELLYFYKVTGNPLFRLSFVNSNWATSLSSYGRENFPSSLVHYPYIIFTDNLISLFYVFIFIAIFYAIIKKKKETYNFLFWFISLLLYLSFGSASFSRYTPFPAASRLLSIITIPGILLLSYFLTRKEHIIRRVLMSSIILLLLVTSIGYIYISDERSAIDNEKAAYEYLQTLPNVQVFADERTVKIFKYLSKYKADNVVGFNSYDSRNPENSSAIDLSKVKNSYVVVNWKLINFLSSSKKGIKFPDEISDIPNNWVLKKEFKNKKNHKIDIYYIS